MSTRNRLYRPAGLADMLLYRMNRLRAVGGGMVLRYCEGRFGVTRREWVMLAMLSDDAPVEPSVLAARAELTKSATSKAISSLMEKGLVERHARCGDRRFAQVALTPLGRATYEQILPVVEGINRAMMSGLQECEIALLDDMLDRIQAQAERLRQQAEALPLANRRRGGTRRAAGAPRARPGMAD